MQEESLHTYQVCVCTGHAMCIERRSMLFNCGCALSITPEDSLRLVEFAPATDLTIHVWTPPPGRSLARRKSRTTPEFISTAASLISQFLGCAASWTTERILVAHCVGSLGSTLSRVVLDSLIAFFLLMLSKTRMHFANSLSLPCCCIVCVIALRSSSSFESVELMGEVCCANLVRQPSSLSRVSNLILHFLIIAEHS